MGMFRSTPENEAAVKWLIDRLRQVPTNDLITWLELKQSSGRDISGKDRHILDRARGRLVAEEGILFSPVVGVGLRRCSDVGAIDDGSRRVQSSRRAARRAANSLGCVKSFETLGADDKRRMLTLQSFAGLIDAVTKPSRMRQVEERMTKRESPLPWKESVEWIKGTAAAE